MAAFNVHLDGRMDFDFDGYEGRACAKELEKIDQILNEQFSIQLSEINITCLLLVMGGCDFFCRSNNVLAPYRCCKILQNCSKVCRPMGMPL